ncbi:di-trans,poly-cis-decaprenylcistransferase [Candidatus Babeliales bacterium]|nr:di-trans,poly-cis-decaprenylcistransferase [Candidatus Babeliales bacterium]
MLKKINQATMFRLSLVVALFVVNALNAQTAEKSSIITTNNKSASKSLNHIAFIADGNRRWAKSKGLSPLEGHRVGFLETAPLLLKKSWEAGIHTVTLWGFSTGNWNRGKEEIDNLMILFEQLINKMLPVAKEIGVKIVHLGRKNKIPQTLLDTINKAEQETANFSNYIFNFGIDYSGRDDICRAFKKIAATGINMEDVTEKIISDHIDTAHQPYQNPDLMIRTSGELRLSGFMAWESTYSELYFPEEYFPALNEESLKKAIAVFNERVRTFSK